VQIVLCYPVEPRHIEKIAAVAPEAKVIDAGQEKIAHEILQADIFCGHAKVPVPWDQVVANGRLRWIQSSAAGMDHCLVPSVIDSSILVTSASGVFADQVAEHTLALLTGWLRNLSTFFLAAQRKEFIRRPTRDLHGATVGIVGMGGNGQRIAEVLAPFRLRLLATDLFPDAVRRPPAVEQIWPADHLGELCKVCDILILCLPLNSDTRGLINRDVFRQMKPDAVLVNVARGPIVVEKDLVEALELQQLAGAALDVTETEPLPPTSRLWDLPNVLITPHVGAQSATRIDATTRLFAENLKHFLVEQPLQNIVDKQLGFPVPGNE
jgi:D-3-phosphoglycerate dehydrogenase